MIMTMIVIGILNRSIACVQKCVSMFSVTMAQQLIGILKRRIACVQDRPGRKDRNSPSQH